MDKKSSFIFLSVLGFSLGMLIGATIFVFLASDENLLNRGFLFVQLIGSGILGTVSMGGTIVYDLENWGLSKATLVHFIMTFAAFLTANELLGWFPHNILFQVLVIMTIIYFIIWLIQFLIWKSKVAKMNEDLKLLNGKNSRA